jgi:hypothetical protein
MKKKILITILVLWSLAITSPSAASPLYAGYNGQSLFWVDTFYFGIDNQARWWVRLPLDMLQGTVRIIFKFESTGALSTEVVLYGITGQGDLLFGFDTDGQSWGESYQAALVTGYDSSGATWTEQEVFDFVGTGTDNLDNTWWFVTFNYQNVLPVSAGMNVSLLTPEPPVEEESAIGEQRKQLSPAGLPSGKKLRKLVGYVKGISRDGELMQKLELLASTSLDSASLLKFAEEEVFPPERREALERMMDDTLD